jgi:hypothetical protein
MSVQKESNDFSIVTNCPLIITPAETVLTYQTSSTVFTNRNVNGRSGECFPNTYAYLDVNSVQKPPQCCSNNALSQNTQKNLNYGLY